ncbi:MAG: SCO1664 family protein [bacterium]|nr:SCO1664 family protein [Candidatus Aquidulcis sp.]
MMHDSPDLRPIGRIAEASNASFLCEITSGLQVIYKPTRGELPLWDFPEGSLAAREVAAYLVSDVLALGVVPPTILRDGPAGEGAVQLWIQHEGVQRAVDLVNTSNDVLRRLALFDAIINNGDRKGGHILPLADGRVLGVDHGVTFSTEPKLRTVLWAWRGEPFSDEERDALTRGLQMLSVGGTLRATLAPLLHATEIEALLQRLSTLRAADRFPEPTPDWPPLPWPLV